MTHSAIALGSNIDPKQHLHAAATQLRAQFPSIRFSSVYSTAPEGYNDQPDFLNAAAVFETNASPEQIASILRTIEDSLGKATPFRFGPRTIDLDLIFSGDTILPDRTTWLQAQSTPLTLPPLPLPLSLPHPRAHLRGFVLLPLLELIPEDLRHPLLGKTWSELYQDLSPQRSQKTDLQL